MTLPPMTDSARQAIDQARAEAKRFNQSFVNSEHLLLALLSSQHTHVSRLLRKHHVDTMGLRANLLSVMPFSENPPDVKGELPLSPRLQKVINHSNSMARVAREPKVCTRLLLLGLLDEGTPAFVRGLKAAGANAEAIVRDAGQKPADVES